VLGYGGGRFLVTLINRLNLITGLYPLLAAAGGVLVYALAAQLGGSGFLAIYIAGLVLGNAKLRAAQNILRVHDGLAWLSQIVMFLILGLLVTPSALLDVAWQGLAVAVFLMLVARPAAVVLSLAPFRFPWREQAYIGWMGLRGAVPIVLALFPFMYVVPNANLYFNIAFFVVLVSLLVQGWTVAPAARLLELEVPPPTEPNQRVTLDVPGHFEHEMVSFEVREGSAVAGRDIAELRVPEGMHLMALLREGLPQALEPGLRFVPGDHAFFLLRPESVEQLGTLFDPHVAPAHLDEHRYFGDFTLQGDAVLGDVAEVYGLEVPPESAALTLDEYISRAFRRRAVVGDAMSVGAAELVVRQIAEGRITRVGLRLPH
jgi:potassium/hydrogen antiporter